MSEISGTENLIISRIPGRTGWYLCLSKGPQSWPLARFVDLKGWDGAERFREWLNAQPGFIRIDSSEGERPADLPAAGTETAA